MVNMNHNSGAFNSERVDKSKALEDGDKTEEQYAANTDNEMQESMGMSKVLGSDNSFQQENEFNGTSARQCHRCGKVLSVDFCLCTFKIPFQCEQCQMNCSSLSEFHMHMQKFHPRKGQHSALKRRNVDTEHAQESHSCDICNEIFCTKLGLLAHRLSHTTHEETSLYKCDQCSREFTSNVRRSIHISRMHTKEKKYFCIVCNKGFSSSSTLETHTRLHQGVKPYKCNICGKCYSQSGNLAYHKSTHAGIKPHVCHICGKAFLTAGILANHERRHTGLKPYVCDCCGRAYADNYTLMHHKIVHSGVRSYMCDVCGKSFSNTHNLAIHKRIHSGEKRYQCSICERTFTQMSTMLQHRNTHTGEKSYHCICGKTFTQQSSLARHRRMHEGTRELFSCHLCDKTFGYKSTLYKHQHRSHGIENPHSK